jgi:hypothetical protein
MSGKVHNGTLINNVIKFSEAFKFGTKEKVSYPKILNESIIDLTNVKKKLQRKITIRDAKWYLILIIKYYYFNDPFI